MEDITKNTNKSNVSNNAEPKQFKANSTYFTISVYAIGVIFVGAVIVKLFISSKETVAAFREIIGILMPFLIGGLIAFILNPAVEKVRLFLEKICKIKKIFIQKILAIALTYLLVLGMIVVVLFGIIPQIISSITDLINYIPNSVTQIYHFVDSLESRFPELDMDVVRKAINDAIPSFINYAKDFATNLVPALYQISKSILQWLLNLIIALIVSVYMLSDKKPLKNSFKAIIYAFIPVKHIASVVEIIKEANKLFSGFITGKAIDSTIIGILCFILMSVLNLPYTVLISVIVGVTNMIPYFGPFIGAVPGIMIMLLIDPLKSLIFAILILVLQQFDGLILGPKILGDSTGLKPLWIIIAITIGGSVGGVLGMFLGVPIVALIRYLLNRLLSYRLGKRNFKEKIHITLD